MTLPAESLTVKRINEVCDVMLSDVENYPSKVYATEVNQIRALALSAREMGQRAFNDACAKDRVIVHYRNQADAMREAIKHYIQFLKGVEQRWENVPRQTIANIRSHLEDLLNEQSLNPKNEEGKP